MCAARSFTECLCTESKVAYADCSTPKVLTVDAVRQVPGKFREGDYLYKLIYKSNINFFSLGN